MLELTPSHLSQGTEVRATPIPPPLPLPWLERANHLATVARLLENTVHEANNGLQVISGQAELLAAMPGPNDGLRVANLGEKARNTSVVLQQLLSFTHDAPDRAERFALSLIGEQAVGLRHHALSRLAIDVVVEKDSAAVFVMASRRRIMQVVLNLVFNVEQALAGRPSPALRLHTGRRADMAELTVEDNGPGLIDEAQAWNPDVLLGSNQLGIGLRVAEAIVEQQGGRLHARRMAPGSGWQVTVSLPAVG